MRQRFIALAVALMLGGAPAWADTAGEETYDMVFRTGTLDAVPRDATLVYAKAVTNTLRPDTTEGEVGQVRLAFDAADPAQAELRFAIGERFRRIGLFPAEVGNPVVMYFMETVIRDMAVTSGGSPFYIRNRMKEALLHSAEVSAVQAEFAGGTVAAQALTMRPFETDPNRARMGPFADLALTVTMSDEVPGWYQSLSATVPGPGDGAPVYAVTMTLEAMETATGGEAMR